MPINCPDTSPAQSHTPPPLAPVLSNNPSPFLSTSKEEHPRAGWKASSMQVTYDFDARDVTGKAPVHGWPGVAPNPVLHDHVVHHAAVPRVHTSVGKDVVPPPLRQLRGEGPGVYLQGVQQAMHLHHRQVFQPLLLRLGTKLCFSVHGAGEFVRSGLDVLETCCL